MVCQTCPVDLDFCSLINNLEVNWNNLSLQISEFVVLVHSVAPSVFNISITFTILHLSVSNLPHTLTVSTYPCQLRFRSFGQVLREQQNSVRRPLWHVVQIKRNLSQIHWLVRLLLWGSFGLGWVVYFSWTLLMSSPNKCKNMTLSKKVQISCNFPHRCNILFLQYILSFRSSGPVEQKCERFRKWPVQNELVLGWRQSQIHLQ